MAPLSCRRGDQVMSKAIEELFPNTCPHWNIQNNSTSRLGAFAGGSKAFNKMFTKCMQGCDSEVEFEETWANNKLLKRWTRDQLLLLQMCSKFQKYESSYKECMDDEAAYRNHGMRYAYGPVMKSREQED